MTKKLLALLLAAVLACFMLSACTSTAQPESVEDEEVSASTSLTEFPEFTTTDLDGNEVDNSIFAEADVTVINFWGTYCPPCIREMPDLAKWSDEMPENVQIIGIVVDVADTDSEEYGTALEIVDKTGAGYTNLLASEGIVSIFEELIGVPTTYFVDSEGKILCDPVVGAYVDQYKSTVEGLL